ncbi:unnamed protein product [Boreogadus saida]
MLKLKYVLFYNADSIQWSWGFGGQAAQGPLWTNYDYVTGSMPAHYPIVSDIPYRAMNLLPLSDLHFLETVPYPSQVAYPNFSQTGSH